MSARISKVGFRAVEGGSAKGQPSIGSLPRVAEIGAAWTHTLAKGFAYLPVSLDDPSFPVPVSARLFPTEAGSARACPVPPPGRAGSEPEADPKA